MDSGKKRSLRSNYYVYVVELDKKVWTDSWKFRNANPQYKGLHKCLYVGMTSQSPRLRFQKHKAGYRNKKGIKISSWYVEKYGTFLRPSLYHHLNPLAKVQAEAMERILANRLKERGYAVWWN